MLDVQGDTDAQHETTQSMHAPDEPRAIEGGAVMCSLDAAAWLCLNDGSNVDMLTQTQREFVNSA